MITVEQALAHVEDQARALPAAERPLIECRGRLLAEHVLATEDAPPFDKSLVDGYAIRAGDLADDPFLNLGETIFAGRTPSRPLGPREAAVIMTGAPMPALADAVVMHEESEESNGRVRFRNPVRRGQNLLPRGRVFTSGDLILKAGERLSAASLGLLASMGKTRASVIPRPRVAIVPTGDELVEPGQIPGPGQIRNSNAVLLEALSLDHDTEATVLPIAPDEPTELSRILRDGLEQDILVITGGVSAGQKDLVPSVLEELEVRPVFHKIRLKPGKPLWFGVGPRRGEDQGTLVFGLPGNPVSSLVGFVLFIVPAIRALSGLAFHSPAMSNAGLATRFVHRGDRPTYHPARRLPDLNPDSVGRIEPITWQGSADLAAVSRANGFAVFPAGDREYEPGDTISFLPFS